MITRKQIIDGMMLEHEGNLGERPVYASVENQVAHSLALYRERGEYTGDIREAMDCLILAGYEIDREDYLVQLARDRYGATVQDNSRKELVEMGRAIEMENQ